MKVNNAIVYKDNRGVYIFARVLDFDDKTIGVITASGHIYRLDRGFHVWHVVEKDAFTKRPILAIQETDCVGGMSNVQGTLLNKDNQVLVDISCQMDSKMDIYTTMMAVLFSKYDDFRRECDFSTE